MWKCELIKCSIIVSFIYNRAYGVLKMDQRVKVRIGDRKVIEMKQGSLETRMGRGEVKVGVPV